MNQLSEATKAVLKYELEELVKNINETESQDKMLQYCTMRDAIHMLLDMDSAYSFADFKTLIREFNHEQLYYTRLRNTQACGGK